MTRHLVATRTILRRTTEGLPRDGRDATFAVFHEDDAGFHALNPRVSIDDEIWADMGHPDTITVTIEPGDRLNPPED